MNQWVALTDRADGGSLCRDTSAICRCTRQTGTLVRNLYDDPRWEETLSRVGLADSQVAQIEFDVTLPR